MNLEDLVLKSLSKRAVEREKIKEIRKNILYEKIPEIEQLILKRNKLAIKIMKLSLAKCSVLKEKNDFEKINKDIEKLLKKNDFSLDYLKNIYYCDICKDTGFTNGKVCSCIMDDLIKDRVLESGFSAKKRKQNFKNFDYSLFEGNFEISSKLVNARVYMEKLIEYAKEYCDNLKLKDFGLYFSGQSGSGKTYFASAMVNYLLDKGKRAKFITANDFFDLMFNYNYSFYKEKIELKDKIDTIKTIEFLVIDDLGNESINKNNNVFLSSILDYRCERGLNTIISSNLNKFDLIDVYDSRVSSRIRGNFKFFEFPPVDLRIKIGSNIRL